MKWDTADTCICDAGSPRRFWLNFMVKVLDRSLSHRGGKIVVLHAPCELRQRHSVMKRLVLILCYGWQRGILVLVSIVQHMNWSYSSFYPVSAGMSDHLWPGIPSWFVTSHLGQLSLASLRGSLNRVPALFNWGNGRNVTSAGWQVALWSHMACQFL